MYDLMSLAPQLTQLSCLSKDNIIEIFEQVLNKILIVNQIDTVALKTSTVKKFMLESRDKKFSLVLFMEHFSFFGKQKEIDVWIESYTINSSDDLIPLTKTKVEIKFPNAFWDRVILTENNNPDYYQSAIEFFTNQGVTK